jgi:hypothetical protein
MIGMKEMQLTRVVRRCMAPVFRDPRDGGLRPDESPRLAVDWIQGRYRNRNTSVGTDASVGTGWRIRCREAATAVAVVVGI